jgi:hypothetical protein
MSFFSVFVLVLGTLISLAWYLEDSPQIFERTVLGINTVFSDEEETEHTYTVAPDVVLSLSNINGPITLIGHKKNQVNILITKKGKKGNFENVISKIEATDTSISIKTIYDKLYNHDNVSVAYQIFVPHNAYLRHIKNINGAINIGHIYSDMIVKNINGAINIDTSHNSVHAQTVNGKISLTIGKLDRHKTISLSSINGAIECFTPVDFSAHIDAETLVGTIISDFKLPGYQKKFTGKHAIGDIGSEKGGSISLKVTHGKIHIHKNDK